MLAVPARAQSVLKFPRITSGRSSRTLLTVTNPTGRFADVQYTFYAMDGPVATSHPVNPVRYRVPPHGTLSLFSDEIFEADVSGWIQATSSVSGLVSGIATFPHKSGRLCPGKQGGVVPQPDCFASEPPRPFAPLLLSQGSHQTMDCSEPSRAAHFTKRSMLPIAGWTSVIL